MMEALALLFLLVVLWCLVAPIFGVLAFRKIAAMELEISALRAGAPVRPSDQVRSPPVATPDETPKPAAPEPAAPASKSAEPPFDKSKWPAPKPKKPKSGGTDWERLIAANWIVWIGGLAIALGGLFLVRVALDAGLFGPMPRTIAAAVLGAGLAGASLVAPRLALVRDADNAIRRLPAILAGAGVIALYGACLAAGALYQFVSPILALGLFLLVSTAAAALSLRHGPVIAAIALSGAFAAPLLTGAEGGSPLVLLPYAAAITGAGLTLIRLKRWRFVSWVVLVGAMFWGLVAIAAAEAEAAWAAPAYALAIAIMALIFAAPAAGEPLRLSRPFVDNLRGLRSASESVFTAYLFWIGSGALIALNALDWASNAYGGAALAVYGGLSLLAAWRREGFSLTAPIAAMVIVTALCLWPDWRDGQAVAALAAGAGFGLIGALIVPRLTVQAPVAAVSALMPPAALFVAFWRGGELQPGFLWGLAALAIACALGFVLDAAARRDPAYERHPGTGAAYALGLALSAGLAPFLMLDGLWIGPAMAVVALAIAATHLRFPTPVLALAGCAAAALATALLIQPDMLREADISTTPVFNELTFSFGLASAALFAGARLLGDRTGAVRAYEAAALAIGFALIGLLIRHAAGGGALYGPYNGFGEASGHAIAYLGLATTLAWRLRRAGLVWRIAEYVALTVGLCGVAAAFFAIEWDNAAGFLILNLLLPAFAMPAVVLTAYSLALRRSERRPHGTIIGAASLMLGFVWVTMETRRLFSGPDLHANLPAGETEMWAYSTGWILYAFALLGWGVWRRQTISRFASLAVLAVALMKVFVFDLGALDGVMRAVSFLGLGAALIGVALFYQRFVFGTGQGSPPAGTSV